MKLKSKLILIMSSSLLLLLFIFSAITQLYLLNSEKQLERSTLISDTLQIANHIYFDTYSDLAKSSAFFADKIGFDSFLKDKSNSFISENINIATMKNLDISLFSVYYKSQIKILSLYDKKTISVIEANDSNSSEFLSYINSLVTNNNKQTINGLIFFGDTPILVTAITIPSGNNFKSFIITGRIINTEMLQNINENLASATVSTANSNSNNIISPKNIEIKISSNIAQTSFKLEDILHKKVIQIKFTNDRDSFLTSTNKILGYGISLSCSLIIVTIICIFIIYYSIIKPIQRMHIAVKKIENGDTNERLPVKGNSEITALSNELNSMLDRIDAFNKKVLESETKFKLVFEATNTGYFSIDVARGIITLDSKAFALLEYDFTLEREIKINEFINIIHKEDVDEFQKLLTQKLRSADLSILLEIRLLSKNNEYRNFFFQGKITDCFDNKPVKMSGIMSDITTKRLAEQEMKYLTYYDKDTGLLNKDSFLEMLRSLDAEFNFPISIIFFDINGLHLINQKFGLEAGDQIIKMLGDVLKNITTEGIVSRFDYDEFAIILAKTNEIQSEKICSDVIHLINENTKMLNISTGYAIKDKQNQKISDIILLATERTGRNKLLSEQSKENVLITNLYKNVTERDFGTEKHSERLYSICNKVGKKFGLRMYQLDDLNLLAAFHDIGKLEVPESILSKKSNLTVEEYEIVKDHTIKGYKKAIEIPYLKSIADEILSHHENYNGSGYPKGLLGKEIPLLARIIRIIDSYDAMTGDRPYKQAISKGQAIEEIKKGSGIQYDPELVKIFIQNI